MRTAPLFLLSLAIIAQPAIAQDAAEPAAPWSVSATYTADTWHVDSREQGSNDRYLDNLDLIADLDAERMFGWGGVQLFAYALYNNGHTLEIDTLQGVSNIEAVDAWHMYEAWAEWAFSPYASVRAGLYDLNSEFDAIDTAGLFLNPSHGIGADFAQSGANGPSIFPATSVAARLQIDMAQWQARVAILDAIPGDPNHLSGTAVRWNSSEGFLYAAEVDYSTSNGARTGFGYWQYSEAFDDVVRVDASGDPLLHSNNRGTYVFAETGAITLADTAGDLRIFTRTGWANDDVNTVSRYSGAGITWSSFVSNRDDQVGIAVAHATVGDPWRASMQAQGVATRSAETILELTGRFAFGDLLVLQPDVQYIRHPGAIDERKPVWAIGIRFEVSISSE